jgi:hypothetical protein
MRYDFKEVVSRGWHCVVYEDVLRKLDEICDEEIELGGRRWQALKLGKEFYGDETEVYLVVDYAKGIIGIVEKTVEEGGVKMKVYWMSRHEPLASQIKELKRLFGDEVEIEQDPNPFSSADDIARRFRESGADELVVVAPLSVIAELVKRGIKPLWAEMQQVDANEAETEAAGRYYKFVKFKRIVGVEIKFEEL